MNKKNIKIDEIEYQGGERLYLGKTETDQNSINEHFSRYEFVKKRLTPGFTVLDAACGTGYGSDFISDATRRIISLEISDHALNWAKDHYKNSNIEFNQADLNKPFNLADNYFDAVVSFETLEHIENQENILSEFRRILKPGGMLFISSPDREIITEKAGTENKFHIHELSKKEFINLLKKYFSVEELYGQTKYVKLPWYKRFLKFLAKADTFKIRRPILKFLGLKMFVHKNLSPIDYSTIEKVDFDSPNNFYVLIAVCKKI